jgi:hypothetical protein
MLMPILKRHWTVDDLEDLPDDGNRYEIIEGELFVTPAPSWTHQDAVLLLAEILRGYLERERVGHLVISPADVRFSRTRSVQPDLFVAPLVNGRRPRRSPTSANCSSPSKSRRLPRRGPIASPSERYFAARVSRSTGSSISTRAPSSDPRRRTRASRCLTSHSSGGRQTPDRRSSSACHRTSLTCSTFRRRGSVRGSTLESRGSMLTTATSPRAPCTTPPPPSARRAAPDSTPAPR